MSFYCPFCSLTAMYVMSAPQPSTGIDITVLKCNKCNRYINLLGVKL